METDECGAAEFFFNGARLLRVPGENGKIDPNAVARTVTQRSSIPYPGPKAILITRSTELGAFYSLDELGAVKDLAWKYDLRLHMDCAPFSNGDLAREFDYRCKQAGQLASKMRFLSAPG